MDSLPQPPNIAHPEHHDYGLLLAASGALARHDPAELPDALAMHYWTDAAPADPNMGTLPPTETERTALVAGFLAGRQQVQGGVK
jgi:hypothetical protein